MLFETRNRAIALMSAVWLCLSISSVPARAGPFEVGPELGGIGGPKLGGIGGPNLGAGVGNDVLRAIPPSLPPSSITGPSGGAPSAGGGPGGTPPSLDLGAAFVLSVCVFDSDNSTTCAQRTVKEAAKKLGWIYYQAARDQLTQSLLEAALSIIFPGGVTGPTQYFMLKDIETRSVKVAEAIMRAQVARLTPFDWKVEDNQRINDWAIRANSEADSGVHWTNWGHIHTFRLGPAYGQADGIHLHIQGWD